MMWVWLLMAVAVGFASSLVLHALDYPDVTLWQHLARGVSVIAVWECSKRALP